MEIRRVYISIKDLVENFIDETEEDVNGGVYALGGKLCVRPKFQRAFVYKEKERQAVIDSCLKGFPISIMYFVENADGSYDCLDGQQRILSICQFCDGGFQFEKNWLNEGKKTYLATLKRVNPELYEKFMNYEIEVYICKGGKEETLEWFHTINIAGKTLTNQELRNAYYVSEWLSDAKRYFSKSTDNGICPAERVGGKYTKANANRQELLEQVICWKIGSIEDKDICDYMEEQVNSTNNASELWSYFNEVIDWIESVFPGMYDKGMNAVNWGEMYAKYGDVEYDPVEMSEMLDKLLKARHDKELDNSPKLATLIEYCFSRDSKLLIPRAFDDIQRRAMYKIQSGKCAHCGEKFDLPDLEAHHIVPWMEGGRTVLDNGELVCRNCHKKHHAE